MPSDYDFPQPYLLAVQPQPEDIDGLNHTNNAVYVRWCEQIAWQHSASLGLSLEEYRLLNRAMAIRHASYDYLLPTVLGEGLELATWLTESDGKLSLTRRFQLRRTLDGETVMRGTWNLVCIEMDSGRPRRMPDPFRSAYLGALVSNVAK